MDRAKQPRLVTRHLIAEQKRQGLRILLAEDNPVNQKLAVILLQKAGFSVDAVENGQHAFEKVKSGKYNAVLMDVQMPEMDGFEATRAIRQWEVLKHSHVPIIAMTAHALKGDRERCLEVGMDDYVSKPLEPQVLFNVLDRWALSPDSFQRDEPVLETRAQPVSPPEPESLNGAELPMDLADALPRFYNDRNFLIEMTQELVNHMPGRMQELHIALDTKNANNLFRLAHNLKGVSANFSAGPVTRIAAQIEALGRVEDTTLAASLVAQLDIEVARLVEFCTHELGVKNP